MAESTAGAAPHDDGETRRDFLTLAAGAMGAVGTVAAIWPLINSLNPAADVLALSTTEVDLSPVAVGQRITVIWQGKPVFVDHRPEKEIQEAQLTPEQLAELRDPQKDSDRVQKPEWLIVIGICTHLGCVPKGQQLGEPRGEYGGWRCVCHGSIYDTSGRIRKGPAPLNLAVPPYQFLDDSTIKIG